MMDQQELAQARPSSRGSVRSTGYAHNTESAPSLERSATPRKRVSACRRCRLQKVKCDGLAPACSNCVKASVDCMKAKGAETEASREYTIQLEKRIQWLEQLVRTLQPTAAFDDVGNFQSQEEFVLVGEMPLFSNRASGLVDHVNHSVVAPLNHGTSISLPRESPAASTSNQIGPSQPLAHDVGLLSLANSSEPKYLGPSSGVPFARLIFSSAPQSQGLSSAWQTIQDGSIGTNSGPHQESPNVKVADLPHEDEIWYFVAAYFEAWHTLYPFLLEESVQELVQRVITYETQNTEQDMASETQAQTFDMAHMFLLLALGAKELETRLSVEFSSEQYYAKAMIYAGKLQLHDSIRGVQILLLLVLCGLSFPNGLNAWFLTSTIIASCIDLGLQRKHVNNHLQNSTTQENDMDSQLREVRSGIFWSAYSLDRTLSVILGRPLTLRDEACDIEYPGEYESEEIAHNAVDHGGSKPSRAQEPQQKRICLPQTISPYLPAVYSFRFDRITAEIKLMIYRVAQSPTRFPWPTDLKEWQEQTRQVSTELLEEVRQILKWRGLTGRRGTLDGALPLIELKYHQCIMLLYRPSPAFPQPSGPALQACYDSALGTIRIQSELQKFAKMVNSWLTAHAVFVSGITLVYCLWMSPQLRHETALEDFLRHTDACEKLLSTLGKHWSVAKNAHVKFARLVKLTAEGWKNHGPGEFTSATQSQPQAQAPPQHTTGEDMDSVDVGDLNSYQPIGILPSNFWDGYNTDCMTGSNLIMDELGDMGSWFDLEWLGDTNYMHQVEAYR